MTDDVSSFRYDLLEKPESLAEDTSGDAATGVEVRKTKRADCKQRVSPTGEPALCDNGFKF